MNLPTMRFSITLLATGIALVAAQAPTTLPPCGQTCVNNMIKIAQDQFGCAAGNISCYCANKNFGYGIRDCSNESCQAKDAATVIAYGDSYCSNTATSGSAVSVLKSAVSTFTASGQSSAVSSGEALGKPTVTISTSGTAPAASTTTAIATKTETSTAVSTSSTVVTVTSSGTTYTTTGLSTIYGVVGGATSGVSTTTIPASSGLTTITSTLSSNDLTSITSTLGSPASSAQTDVSTAIASISSVISSESVALSSVESSVKSTVTSTSSSTPSSSGAKVTTETSTVTSTSSGLGAPRRTAGPMLGAAAVAALMLV